MFTLKLFTVETNLKSRKTLSANHKPGSIMKLLNRLQVFRITVCMCVLSFLSLCTLNFWKILYYVKYRWPFKSFSHIQLAGKQLILIQKYLGACGQIVTECVLLQPLSYL